MASPIKLPIDDLAALDFLLDCGADDDEAIETVPPLSADTFPDIATHLRLWQLCERPGCRQARRCRGDQTVCCRSHTIPPYVGAWFFAMAEACDDEGGFTQALQTVEFEYTTAVNAWCAALKAMEESERRRRRQRGGKADAAPAARQEKSLSR